MPHRRHVFAAPRNLGNMRGDVRFRNGLPVVSVEVCVEHRPRGREQYHPIPGESAPSVPFRLEDILGPSAIRSIKEKGALVFHAAGDTGGIKRPESQRIVADKMEEDFYRADRRLAPSFFYILGDVIYYHGERSEYYPQFYDPYLHYPAPIFAIPGNHDGDPNPRNAESSSLDGFLENFCAPAPVLAPDAGDANRTAMTQPNPYWVLDGPWIRVIGLYTNVPEGGEVRDLQKEWFCEQLKESLDDKPLFLTLHHPIYSADSHHGGSIAMEKLLFWGAERSGKLPDLVLTGHVHNYQRFTLSRDGIEIPVIVAGAGGYWYLHSMAPALRGMQGPVAIEGREDLVLESYCDDRHGFLRFEVAGSEIACEYLTVPRPHESWRSGPVRWDRFRLDRKTRRLSYASGSV